MNELGVNRERLRSFHLFAGGGGGMLADLLLGHRIVGACEIGPYPRNCVLQRQRDGIFPKFPIWDDIRTFDGNPWNGYVDIVAGGFPCQDISAAGKGAGIGGERSGLWGEMARVVREIRPRFVFVENSPLLVGRGLAVVLGDLAQMGYDAKWCCLSAEAVILHLGDPEFYHERNRIWILAYEAADGQSKGLEGHRSNTGKSKVSKSWDDCASEASNGVRILKGREEQRSVGERAGPGGEPIEKATEPKGTGAGINQRWIRNRSCGADGAEEREGEASKTSDIHKQHDDSGGYGASEVFGKFRRSPFISGGEIGGTWWQFEPDVGRVVHGVGNRVDRLKALGNGQVPLVAATAWRALLDR